MPHKGNDPRRHKIPKARYRIENWPAYDAALRNRGDLTDAGGAGGVASADERPTRSIAAILGSGDRDRDDAALGVRPALAAGLLRSVAQLMNLEVGIPDHTTLSRRSAAMSPGLGLAGAKGSVHVVIDSTGLKMYGVGELAPEADVIIPPRATAKASAQANQAPTQRDRHIQTTSPSAGVLAGSGPPATVAGPWLRPRCFATKR